MDEQRRVQSLRQSFARTIIVYFLCQCAVFCVFALPGGFFAAFGTAFILTSASFHVFLLLLLNVFIDDFRKEATQEKLSSINLANKITLVRVSTLPTLLFLVVAARSYRIRYPLLILVVFIFVTDFLDGYISRKDNEVTKAGRMMDSASDYSLLIVLTLVFHYYRLIPIWFLVLVLTRLGLQVLFMAILITVKRRIEPTATFMGKVAVASIMFVYSVEVFGLIAGELPLLLKNTIEWTVAVLIVASIGDKAISFAAAMKGLKFERRISDGIDKERP